MDSGLKPFCFQAPTYLQYRKARRAWYFCSCQHMTKLSNGEPFCNAKDSIFMCRSTNYTRSMLAWCTCMTDACGMLPVVLAALSSSVHAYT